VVVYRLPTPGGEGLSWRIYSRPCPEQTGKRHALTPPAFNTTPYPISGRGNASQSRGHVAKLPWSVDNEV